MPLKKCSGRVELDSVAIAEVKSYSASHSMAEDDTSIIDSSCNTRTSFGKKTITLSLNVYQDPTDASQTALIEGATGFEVTIFPAGNATGMPKRVYSDCGVKSWADDGGTEGYVEANLELVCNGGVVRSVVA